MSLRADEVHFPRPSDGRKLIAFDWTRIRYRNVISVLKNPVYANGKSENRTKIIDGRARKTYGHYRPLQECEIFLKNHHEGYIDWAGAFNLRAMRTAFDPSSTVRFTK